MTDFRETENETCSKGYTYWIFPLQNFVQQEDDYFLTVFSRITGQDGLQLTCHSSTKNAQGKMQENETAKYKYCTSCTNNA